ncbi:MAG: hypothetical protein KatS3mg055_3305 [Chloroflexus sp.]|nr:MAG: hypothetical protein KatS3mg055_3305 [Chloroflexus sp.]
MPTAPAPRKRVAPRSPVRSPRAYRPTSDAEVGMPTAPAPRKRVAPRSPVRSPRAYRPTSDAEVDMRAEQAWHHRGLRHSTIVMLSLGKGKSAGKAWHHRRLRNYSVSVAPPISGIPVTPQHAHYHTEPFLFVIAGAPPTTDTRQARKLTAQTHHNQEDFDLSTGHHAKPKPDNPNVDHLTYRSSRHSRSDRRD